jgi:hypothetical protein
LCWCFWFVCLCCCTPQFEHSFVLALGYVSMSLGIAGQARTRVIVGLFFHCSWVCLFKQGVVVVWGCLFNVVGNHSFNTVFVSVLFCFPMFLGIVV